MLSSITDRFGIGRRKERERELYELMLTVQIAIPDETASSYIRSNRCRIPLTYDINYKSHRLESFHKIFHFNRERHVMVRKLPIWCLFLGFKMDSRCLKTCNSSRVFGDPTENLNLLY
ncbi:hypothetical protein Tcan_00135 [Toxocara canis]|uniref:Uncharacterized protein n=1 Tax=Toxocara canis TaxID=6265 RepID=A0A0B2VTX8_TOXCA|nr:hypothetical protein Tcan_00135 [Toxocara canis]